MQKRGGKRKNKNTFQSAGVATFLVAVSCNESITRRISLRKRGEKSDLLLRESFRFKGNVAAKQDHFTRRVFQILLMSDVSRFFKYKKTAVANGKQHQRTHFKSRITNCAKSEKTQLVLERTTSPDPSNGPQTFSRCNLRKLMAS